MKAALCREFGKPLVIEDVTLAPPGPGEVRVTVKACAICHSDITYAEGGWGGDLPILFGHEAAGVVTELGAGVSHLAVGDHVVATLIRSCKTCHYCAQGDEVLCETTFALDRKSPVTDSSGQPVGHGLRTGAFAEEIVVEASQLVAIPKDIPFASASLLACGVITGYGAVTNTARIKPGSHVVVIGCGGVGLNSIQGAVAAGAGSIVALDLDADKRDVAIRYGATHAFDPREDVRAALKPITEGRMADFVFVTVGVKPALDSATSFIAKNGTVVVVGMPPSGVMGEYDPGYVAAWNQKIIGSKMGSSVISRDIPQLVARYRDGKLVLDDLVTNTYPLDRINEAIASTKSGKALRNVIVFD